MVSRTKKASSQARGQATGVAFRLKPYHQKRHFDRTPEPSGRQTRAPRAQALQFVVQKHAASHLHYDFRLELDGVLLSWSVPKGPTQKPGLRRLAVRTEDHPLEYANFEGVIPKGEYGGGTVIVWDRGVWIPEGDPHQGVDKGHLSFELRGEKLHGRFHLVRTRLDAGKHENWLLFKGNDAAASDADLLRDRPESALSGQTIEEVAALPRRVWHSTGEGAERGQRHSEAVPNRRHSEAVPNRRHSEAVPKTPSPRTRGAGKKTAPHPGDTSQLVKQLPVSFALTNLDKVLYPEANLRKSDVIAYYATIASFMLPHVSHRPLTLVRCPDGRKKCFFQKHVTAGVPDAVLRVPIKESNKTREYMAIRDLPGLIALAQLGALEIHTWCCHDGAIERPDKVVFDLDPHETVTWDGVIEAAMELRQRLGDIGLESFVQTTGGKGLHVVAPLQPRLTWDEHKEFARAIARSMAEERPDRYLINMRKDLRGGRIFVDYLRNGRGATAIAPYSTRARDMATIAAPITWDELAAGVRADQFTIDSMVERISEIEVDPWKRYATLKQTVSKVALRSLGLRA